MGDLDKYNQQKCFSVFRDFINKDDSWTCHHNSIPEPNTAYWVIIFEPTPFIGLEYQMFIATYDSFDDSYIDVINGLRRHVDSPVCTYWKYM